MQLERLKSLKALRVNLLHRRTLGLRSIANVMNERQEKIVIARSEATWQSYEIASLRSQ
jgi:hypothetical protein